METIAREFKDLERRLQRVLRADGVAGLCALIAIWGLASLGLDRMLEMSRPWRVAALVLLLFLGTRAFLVLRRRLRRGAPVAALAEAVEKRHPELEGQLLNALSFREELREAKAAGAGELEETLMKRALQEAEKALKSVRFARALDLRPVVSRALLCMGALGLLVSVAAFFPSTTGLWLRRNLFLSNAPWPRDTLLTLDREDDPWHCARGESLGILGWARGKVPTEVTVHIRGATGSRRAAIIPGANGRLSFVLPEVAEPFEFHLRGGDGRTDPRRVEVHDRPRVLSLSFDLAFPEYLGRASEGLSNPAGDITVPAGSSVTARAAADVPLKGGWAQWEKTEKVELTPRGSSGPEAASVEHRFEPKANGSLDLTVVDSAWGLESRPPVRVRFQVQPDAVPRLTLTLKQKPRMVTPLASVPYRVEAKDDHGFTRVGLEVAVGTGEDQKKELIAFEGLPAREPAILREETLELEPRGLEPGMRLTLTAEGADNDGLSGPKAARSNSETLLVVGLEEFREAMARARAAARRDLEDVLSREERIARELPPAVEAAEAAREAAAEAGEGEGGTGAISRLGREQAEAGQRVKRSAQDLREVADALRQNRMMNDAEDRRFEAEVTAPLSELAEDRIPRSASEISGIARAGDPKAGARASGELEAIADSLRGILDRLADTEDFSDVLHRLENVLQLHRKAIATTRDQSALPVEAPPIKKAPRERVRKEKEL